VLSCIMNTATKRMIMGYARRISSSWPPKNSAKDKAKVAPALHRCDKCGSLNYEGESQKSFDKYVAQFPESTVNFDGIEMDHIAPVIAITGWTNWDDYFNSLFCPEENFRALCNPCHSLKSINENSHRASHKTKRKK